MKFLLSFFFTLLTTAVALSNMTGSYKVTGTVIGLSEKYVEVRSGTTSLLIPKAMVPKPQAKTGELIDIEVSKADLDKIELKK